MTAHPNQSNKMRPRPGFCWDSDQSALSSFQQARLGWGRAALTTGPLCCGEDKTSQASQGTTSRFICCAAWVVAAHLWASCEEMHVLGRSLPTPHLTRQTEPMCCAAGNLESKRVSCPRLDIWSVLLRQNKRRAFGGAQVMIVKACLYAGPLH